MDTFEAEDANDRSKRVVRTQLNLLMRTSLFPFPPPAARSHPARAHPD